MTRDKIDIIIPIYNGYEDLLMCLDSVEKYTDLKTHRVLLINDKSTDERILPFLKGRETANIIVFDNEVNKGFSGSINRGIEYGDRDVILLNSDTIVTKGWAEKIMKSANMDSSIATVTPLSNCATLCSVPVFCQDNEMPENITIDEYAELIEMCSLKRYPTIPVAVGFCMYIKREVIDLIGLFDAKTFGRGYGEENDFCHRAEQFGYYHIMCDDTFIYHKGTVSFPSEEKKKLIEEHIAILQERYPMQNQAVEEYCACNPEQYIRDNINLYMVSRNGKKNILYLLQSDFREDAYDHLGGTQFHVKDLSMNLKYDYNIFVMARDGRNLNLTIYANEDMVSFKFLLGSKPPYPIYYSKMYQEIFEMVLDSYCIDYVHIHHVLGLSLDLFQIAKKRKVPLFASVHDYFYASPNVKLYNYKEESGSGISQMWQINKFVKNQVLMERWNAENHKALSLCDKIIFPSNRAKEIMLEYYRDLSDSSVVIEHGSDISYMAPQVNIDKVETTKDALENIDFLYTIPNDPECILGWSLLDKADNKYVKTYIEITDSLKMTRIYGTTKYEREDVSQMMESNKYLNTGFKVNAHKLLFAQGNLSIRVLLEYKEKFYTSGKVITYNYQGKSINSANFNVAFIGAMIEEKGSNLVREMIMSCKTGINWFVIGASSEGNFFDFNQNNAFTLGGYNRDEIFDILEQFKIDLVCILPQWEETFCYTLSEAWICKIPVVVTDIGAVGERVREKGGGFVVPVQSEAKDILALIDKIRRDRLMYEKAKNEITKDFVVGIPQMVDSYKELYASYYNSKERMKEYNSFKMFFAYKRANIRLSKEEIRLSNELQELSNKLVREEAIIKELRNQLDFKNEVNTKSTIRKLGATIYRKMHSVYSGFKKRIQNSNESNGKG